MICLQSENKVRFYSTSAAKRDKAPTLTELPRFNSSHRSRHTKDLEKAPDDSRYYTMLHLRREFPSLRFLLILEVM